MTGSRKDTAEYRPLTQQDVVGCAVPLMFSSVPVLALHAKKKLSDIPHIVRNQLGAKLTGSEQVSLIKMECSNHSNCKSDSNLPAAATNQLTKDRCLQFRGSTIMSLFLWSLQPLDPLLLYP